MKKNKSVGQRPLGMSNALTPDMQQKRNEYRRKRRLKALSVVLIAALVMTVCAVLIFSFMSADVITSLTIEAGDDMVSASDFFDGDVRAFFVPEEEIDTSKPGKYDLTVRNGIIFHKVTLNILDTIAPAAKPKHVRIKQGESNKDAFSFVKSVEDKSEVTARFETPINYNTLGDSDVTVILTDLGGNEYRCTSKLTIYPEEIIPAMTFEAGYADLSVKDFLSRGAAEYENDGIITELDSGFFHRVGSTDIEIMYCSTVYTVKITVEDTRQPRAYIKNQTTYKGVPLPAEKFIERFYDETQVSVSYLKEPDFDKTGAQLAEIILEDGAKNTRTYKVTLTVLNDTTKPEISAEDRTVYIGDNIRFSEGVTVSDNCDENPTLKVDIGGFDKTAAGVYPIRFIATDKSGNTAEKTVNFTLKNKHYYLYTQEVMTELFQSTFSKLNITPSMTQKQKVKVIYDFVRENISYNGTSEKSDWEQEAYRGLRSKAGDSFTFYAVSRKLLTMAGIENEAVKRIKSDSDHYWNMINVDGVRYHFDACPHYKDFPIESYMLTDAQAAEYSKKTNGYYTYK